MRIPVLVSVLLASASVVAQEEPTAESQSDTSAAMETTAAEAVALFEEYIETYQKRMATSRVEDAAEADHLNQLMEEQREEQREELLAVLEGDQ